MNCPTDGTTLLMSERQGIEIDYCPECRGVWLDRGELDKILERTQTEANALIAQAAPAEPAPYNPHQQAPAAPQQYTQRGQDERYTQRSSDDRYMQRSSDDRYADRRDGGHDPRYTSRKKKSPFDFLGELFE